MTNLRGAIIRLARKNPGLRSGLLPLLKQAMEFDTPEALENYFKEHPGADKSKHTVKKKEEKEEEAGGGADSKDGPKGKWVSEYKPEKFYSPEHEEAWESVKFHAQKRDDLEDKLKKKIKGPVPEDVYFHADPKSKTVWFKDEKGGVVNVPNTQRESAELNDVFGALREEVKKMDREEEKGKRKEEEAGSKKATLRASLIRLAHENPELRSHLLPILAKSAAKVWKAKKITDQMVEAQAQLYWSPRQQTFDPTMMGNSSAKTMLPQLVQGFEFDLASEFYFSPWNKDQASEIEKEVLASGHPNAKNIGHNLALSVFNSHSGSSQPSFYWDAKYSGRLKDLKAYIPQLREIGMGDVAAKVQTYVENVETIRKDTEKMIEASVRSGLKKLGMDPTLIGEADKFAAKDEITHRIVTPEMRLAALTVKLAHKPILQPQGLDMRAVKEGMGTMLYFIDGAKNHSKFYEMLVVPSGGGFTLMRRWGALTDTGMTGRVDSKDMPFMSLRQAQAELAKIYREKVGKGYKDAFNGKMHVSPATGERLPLGQYPVGLTRTPGFGWGTQSATVCIPSLRDLQEKLDSALNELEEDSDLSMLLADMEGAQRLINALMRNPQAIEAETNKSMGDIIDKAMKTPLSRIRALQGMARTGPGRLPDLDRGKLRSELVAIRNYVRKQLSYCA